MILLLALITLPFDVTHTVDAIEVNHTHSGCDQLILWNDGHVDYWQHHEGVSEAKKIGGWWEVRITRNGRLVKVRSRSYSETWTNHDPEVADREWWPMCERRWQQ